MPTNKQEFLAGIIDRRIVSLLENITVKCKQLVEICPKVIELLSSDNLVHVFHTHDSFICELLSVDFVDLQSKNALEMNAWCHKLFGSPHLDKSNSSPMLDHSDLVDLPNSSRSPLSEIPPNVETARLSNCNRVSSLLDMELNLEQAALKRQKEFLLECLNRDDLSRFILSNENINRDIDLENKKRLDILKCQYAELAEELTFYDALARKKVALELKRNRQEAFVQRLDKVLEIAKQENALAHLLSDLLQYESDLFLKIDNQLKIIHDSAKYLLVNGTELLIRLSAMCPRGTNESLDRLTRLSLIRQFEHNVRDILKQYCIPQVMDDLTESYSPEALLSLFENLQKKLSDDQQLIQNTLKDISCKADQLNELFRLLAKTFRLPASTLELSQPHTDRVNGARLEALSAGLCDPKITNSLVSMCANIDEIAGQFSSLRHQADVLFATRSTTTN